MDVQPGQNISRVLHELVEVCVGSSLPPFLPKEGLHVTLSKGLSKLLHPVCCSVAV